MGLRPKKSYLLGEKGPERIHLITEVRRRCRSKQRLKYDWSDNAKWISMQRISEFQMAENRESKNCEFL